MEIVLMPSPNIKLNCHGHELFGFENYHTSHEEAAAILYPFSLSCSDSSEQRV